MFSRCKSVHLLATDKTCRSQNTVWLTTSAKVNYKIQKERSLYLVLRLRGETEHDTNDNATIKGIASAWWNRARHQWQRDHQDPEHFQHSAHEHWHVSAQFSCLLVRFLSSRFTHCITWLKSVLCAHLMSIHEVSVSLRPWVLHSLHLLHLLIHPLPLALPAALLPLPLLTTPTSSQVMSPTPTTSRRLTSSPTRSPWPTHSSPSKGSSRTWSTMTPHSRICFITKLSTCLSLPARRLVCRSVVVVRVRANGTIRWRANNATCWTNWSGAKCCKCTD